MLFRRSRAVWVACLGLLAAGSAQGQSGSIPAEELRGREVASRSVALPLTPNPSSDLPDPTRPDNNGVFLLELAEERSVQATSTVYVTEAGTYNFFYEYTPGIGEFRGIELSGFREVESIRAFNREVPGLTPEIVRFPLPLVPPTYVESSATGFSPNITFSGANAIEYSQPPPSGARTAIFNFSTDDIADGALFGPDSDGFRVDNGGGPGDSGDPDPIPTPTALAAGLTLGLSVLLRRRQRIYA
ncbi:MAG: hypothetical protein AAF916_10200 [Planctomycetota bacterium]